MGLVVAGLVAAQPQLQRFRSFHSPGFLNFPARFGIPYHLSHNLLKLVQRATGKRDKREVIFGM